MAMAAEKRETSTLIGSDKVEGTNVDRSNGDKIGAIERIMLDKQSGKVAYAVMSFGGFLGIGHEHYPVPWSLLTYNTQLGGYEVNISEQQLKGAPNYANDNDWDWEDRKRAQQVYDYYRVPPYWMCNAGIARFPHKPPVLISGRGGFHVRRQALAGARGCAPTSLTTGTRFSTGCCSGSACWRADSAPSSPARSFARSAERAARA